MFDLRKKHEAEIKRYGDALAEAREENRELRQMYDELKIEQQKDKALWIAMCAPEAGGISDESNSSATPDRNDNERPVPSHWHGPE